MVYLYIFITPQFVSKACFSRDSASSPQIYFCSKDFPYAYHSVLRKSLEETGFQETVFILSLVWKILFFYKRSTRVCLFTKVKEAYKSTLPFKHLAVEHFSNYLSCVIYQYIIANFLQYSKTCKKVSSIKEKKTQFAEFLISLIRILCFK